MSKLIKDLGAVSAYAYAVEKGYTGTEDEFAELMYDYTDVAQTAVEAKDEAVSASASAQASATTANTKADEASASASKAQSASDSAQGAETNAETFASNAGTKATEAKQFADKAELNAQKTQSDKEAVESAKSDVLSAVDSAQNYANSAQSASQAIQDMDVKATTLEPDSDATVEKTVDAISGAVTLTYGIPKGIKGDKGNKGDTGDSGVYIGASAPSDESVKVWIYSDGEPDDVIQIDDTLTQSGQAADAKATGDKITAVKTFANNAILADQFKNYTWTDGYLVRHDNGNSVENSNYSFAEFDVSGYKTIHVNSYMASTAGVCFYNDSGAFVAGFKNNTPSEYSADLSVPANATTVKVSCTTEHKEVLLVYQYMQEQIDEIQQANRNTEESLGMGWISSGDAKLPTDTYHATITSNGDISPTSNANFNLRKYTVIKGTTYVIKGTQVDVHYDAYGLAAFSESEFTGTKIKSQLIIYGSGATPTDYDVTFMAPADGFIYLLSYGTESYKPVLDLYDSETVPKLLYTLTGTTKDIIKVQAFGDSITDDSWRSDSTTWLTLLPYYIPQRQFSIKNEAVGGSHIGHGRVNSDTGKYYELEYNYVYDLMTNADIFDPTSDIIVMFVGTNDFNSSPLGQWGDTTIDTFYGAAKMVCEYISQNTSALFLVVTPIARPDDADSTKQLNENGERVNGYGATLREYAEALIRTCEFYQFPVIDLFHNIGWNKTNVRAYLDATGVHPSIKGSNAICAYISSVIKKYFGI